MSETGNVHRDPPPPMTPALVIDNSLTNYIRTEDGQTILAFTPVVQIGDQLAMQPPQIRVVFSADGWKLFQREVAADGAKSPIQISRQIPGTPPA